MRIRITLLFKYRYGSESSIKKTWKKITLWRVFFTWKKLKIAQKKETMDLLQIYFIRKNFPPGSGSMPTALVKTFRSNIDLRPLAQALDARVSVTPCRQNKKKFETIRQFCGAGAGLFWWSRRKWAGSGLMLCDLGALRWQSWDISYNFIQIITIFAQIERKKRYIWKKVKLSCFIFQNCIFFIKFV